MKKANAGHTTNKVEFKGYRIVKGPVTGNDVVIKDADFGGKQRSRFHVSIANAKSCRIAAYDADRVDPTKQGKGETAALSAPPKNPAAYSTLHTSPKPASPTNLLLQPFPAPVDIKTVTSIHGALNTIAAGVGAAMFVLWFLTAFRSGFWAFLFRTAIIGSVGVGTFFAVGVQGRRIEKDLERARAEMHRQRALNHSPPVPESTEWLNALFATVWPLVDPSLFASVVDMVEDIMQASLPKFVDAVRISDLGLGTNPFRIIAMRGLPDHQTDRDYPREEWIYRAKPSDAQVADTPGNPTGSADGARKARDPGAVAQKKEGIDGEAQRQRKIDDAVQTKKEMGQPSMNDVDKTAEELDQAGDYVNYVRCPQHAVFITGLICPYACTDNRRSAWCIKQSPARTKSSEQAISTC